jgi:hypothetical protein
VCYEKLLFWYRNHEVMKYMPDYYRHKHEEKEHSEESYSSLLFQKMKEKIKTHFKSFDWQKSK